MTPFVLIVLLIEYIRQQQPLDVRLLKIQDSVRIRIGFGCLLSVKLLWDEITNCWNL